MALPTYLIKAAQHAAGTKTDGIVGPLTRAALREYADEYYEALEFADHLDRLLVAVAQHAAGLTGKDLDGKLGPDTEEAVRRYLDQNGIESAAARPARSSTMAVWQPHEGPGVYAIDDIDLRDARVIVPPDGLDPVPARRNMNAVYGDALALGKDGIKRRLVTLRGLPGRFNRGDGVLYSVHRLAAPHLRLALELCDKLGVVDEIYRVGTFNYRHMRHDPALPLSYHAYGICVDLNPRENHGWTPSRQNPRIEPFTGAWWKKYPRGLSEVAVLCFKKAGFVWGGDWTSFCDPMHFELVRPS